jgi:transposase
LCGAKDAKTITHFAEYLAEHKAMPEQVRSVSIDMSPAFIKGVARQLPNARITFDKFHVVAHASAAVDQTRRIEQTRRPDLFAFRPWQERNGSLPFRYGSSARGRARNSESVAVSIHDKNRANAVFSSCVLLYNVDVFVSGNCHCVL